MRLVLALALAAASTSVAADIPVQSGLAGTWWNPAKGGGFTLQFSTFDNAPLASLVWYSYDDGAPIYLVGAVPYNATATSIAFPMSSTRGGEFGDAYDPADIVNAPWGNVTIAFDSCNAGKVTYSSDEHGDGEIELIRLGAPLGFTCEDQAPPQQYTFPYLAGPYTVVRSRDAITDEGSCLLYAEQEGSLYDGVFTVSKFGPTKPIQIRTYIALGNTATYSPNASSSVFRVDGNSPITLSTVNLQRSDTTGEPSTTSRSPDNFGGLLPQLKSGSQLVARIVPLNGGGVVPTVDMTLPLGRFVEALGAFDACVDAINAGG